MWFLVEAEFVGARLKAFFHRLEILPHQLVNDHGVDPFAYKFLQVDDVVVRRYCVAPSRTDLGVDLVGVGIAQDGGDLKLLLDVIGDPERPVADRLRRDEALAIVAMAALSRSSLIASADA